MSQMINEVMRVQALMGDGVRVKKTGSWNQGAETMEELVWQRWGAYLFCFCTTLLGTWSFPDQGSPAVALKTLKSFVSLSFKI